MSHWNYRVCNVDGLFSIQEVYYDDDNKPNGFCNASVDNWESTEDLKSTLESMLRAFDKPIIGK